MVNIYIVLGTRPELIKMSPIIRACEDKPTDYFILHTGQHYSYEMDRALFEYPLYSLADACAGSDCIVFITGHSCFKTLNPVELQIRTNNLFDSQNCLEHEGWDKAGFTISVLGVQ